VNVKKLLLLLFVPVYLFCQEESKSTIEILNADLLEFENNPERGKIKKLIGRVALQDKDVLLVCDSAFIYEDSSDFEAFGNVKVRRSDSLTIFSDYLYYDKGQKTALLKTNVIIDHQEIHLKTDELTYYINQKYAYYPHEGKLEHPDFDLVSKQGYYFEELQYASFIDHAIAQGKNYKLISDTINYYYNTKKSFFSGPTSIQTDSLTGFGNAGYHIPKENILLLKKKAWILTKDQYIQGDSLYFNQKKGKGHAHVNVTWKDSTKTKIIHGDHLYYDKKEKTTLVTDNVIFENIINTDTMFMAADSMYAYNTFIINYDSVYTLERIDSIYSENDSVKIDSIFYLDSINSDTIYTQAIRANYDVKLMYGNISGIADSMRYLMYDSTFRFYKNPILWSDSTQISGDSIHIEIKAEKLHRLFVFGKTLMASLVLENYFYNQIIGDKVTGYFRNDSLHKVIVNENAESIYFIQDNDGQFVGANKGKSKSIHVRLINNNINQVIFITNPSATFLPMRNLKPQSINFARFKWEMKFKPIKSTDLKQPGRYKQFLSEEKIKFPESEEDSLEIKNLRD